MLGRAGLKRLTPRAMTALIVSANLPDIDSWVAPLWGEDSLAAHRGFTHGLGGLVTMPILATAMILFWEKLYHGKKCPVDARWLLLLCFIGTLSHPLFDFLTGYGTRLLEPFSHRWFYGDTLFIVDPWIWIILILGIEMSWRAERLSRNWMTPAFWALGAVVAYIALNAAISLRAVAVTRPFVERVAEPRMIVASEIPLEFWKRRMIWRGDAIGGTGTYNLLAGINHVSLDPKIVPLGLDDSRLALAEQGNNHVRAFLFWSRMPMVFERNGRAYLTDQRFFDSGRAPSSTFLIPLDKQ